LTTHAHTTAQLKRKPDGLSELIHDDARDMKVKGSTLLLLAGSEWIMDLIKTILRVAMK